MTNSHIYRANLKHASKYQCGFIPQFESWLQLISVHRKKSLLMILDNEQYRIEHRRDSHLNFT